MDEPQQAPSSLMTVCVWIVWAVIGVIIWMPAATLLCRKLRE